MKLSHIVEILNIIKIEVEQKLDVKRIFEYKEDIAVIDFTYLGRSFAFDIILQNQDILCVRLVWREGAKQYCNIMRISECIESFDLYNKLRLYINNVVEFLNKYAKILCSVIVPVYNRERLIVPLIDSLNNQTLNKELFEVIFIDDNSSDNTINTIKNLSTKFNFRIIEMPVCSGSASAPRNIGIKLSCGDYILFCDSDDYLFDYTLKDVIEYADKCASDIVFLKLEGVNRSVGTMCRTYNGKNVSDAKVFKNFLFLHFPPHKLFRTQLLKVNNILFDPSFEKEEDKLFLLQAMVFSKKISILKDKSYICCTSHDGDHLSKKTECNKSFRIYRLWTYGISIIMSNKNNISKREMYNAWLYRFIRAYKKNLLDNNSDVFESILNMFIKYIEMFDLSLIYKDMKETVLKIFSIYVDGFKFNEYIKIESAFTDNNNVALSSCKKINLYYWIRKTRNKYNYGDLLNEFLIKRIANADIEYKEPNYDDKVCAIGSIINNTTLKSKSIFWGSGTHYEKLLLHNSDSEFRAVRGPITRQILINAGYSCPDTYGDPALLMPEYYKCKRSSVYKYGVIMHYAHANKIKTTEDVLNINILRDRDDIFGLIDEICKCNYIFSSSLHGIILANAYGIPARWFQVKNIPLAQGGHVKFNDYFESVNLPIQSPLVFSVNHKISNDTVWDINTIIDIKLDINKLKESFPFDKVY